MISYEFFYYDMGYWMYLDTAIVTNVAEKEGVARENAKALSERYNTRIKYRQVGSTGEDAWKEYP